MATVKEVDLTLALWPLLSKRVEIVRLDLLQPDILLADNPLGALDARSTSLQEAFLAVAASSGEPINVTDNREGVAA